MRVSNRARVLLIDDDPDYLRAFQDHHRDWFVVETRTDGEALFRDMNLAREYKALVVDLHMPGVDGLNLAYRAKQILNPIFPVFIITHDQDEQSKVLGLKLKIDDYLTKNMSWTEIALRIQNRITRHTF